MASGNNKVTKTAVWILMAMLIVGLAGFGATNLSGNLRTVGSVGNETISVDDFAREMQQEMRAAEAQLGQPVTMEIARTMGLDQRAISRLITLGALDNEAWEMGLSLGDENLRDEVLQISAFQGPGGQFDRETYRLALENVGLSESEFEDDLRSETARTLLQGAIVSGVNMPDDLTDAVVDFVASRRSFTWAPVEESDLTDPLPEPTDSDLKAFYDGNPELFRLPETKSITYALLSPDMLIDSVEVDQDALLALYDERADQYNVPERRLVERLVFPDEAAASDALAQLEVGGTTFEQLVTDRGLTMIDVDMGDVAMTDLNGAGQAVFEAEFGDVVGPLPSALGPALFRVNGFVAARNVPFEEAEAELREELAAERARRVIEGQSEDFNDLLAGGATLEELADESDMELGAIDWFEGNESDVAGYEAFRAAAAAVTQDDFPEILFLDDGSIVALRLDEVLPERPEPYEDAMEAVVEGWTAEALTTLLAAQAEGAVAALENGEDFAAAGLEPQTEEGLTRSDFVPGAPFSIMTEVFEMEPGEVRVVAGAGGVVVVRLDEELPPAEDGQVAQLRQSLTQQLDQTLAQELFEVFARDVQLRAQPQIDQNAVTAVLNSFQ